MAFWFRFKNIFSVIASVQDCPPLVQICLNTWNTWNTLLGQRHYLECIGPTYIWYITHKQSSKILQLVKNFLHSIHIYNLAFLCAVSNISQPTLCPLPTCNPCSPEKKLEGANFMSYSYSYVWIVSSIYRFQN